MWKYSKSHTILKIEKKIKNYKPSKKLFQNAARTRWGRIFGSKYLAIFCLFDVEVFGVERSFVTCLCNAGRCCFSRINIAFCFSVFAFLRDGFFVAGLFHLFMADPLRGIPPPPTPGSGQHSWKSLLENEFQMTHRRHSAWFCTLFNAASFRFAITNDIFKHS